MLTASRLVGRSSREGFADSPEVMRLTNLCDRLECGHFRLSGLFVDLIAGCSGDLKERITIVGRQVLEHLRQEEEVLFPLIRELDETGSVSEEGRAELGRQMKAMRDEHGLLEEVLDDLESLEIEREGVFDERMKDGLSKLTDVLHRQIHEENQILYRRVAGLVRIPA